MEEADRLMDWIIGIALVCVFIWWLFRPGRPTAVVSRSIKPAKPIYEDYRDAIERKSIDELDAEEQIIRRAHDAFNAERDNRTAEYRAKRDALAADEKKIARGTDFIETSFLSLALPFVQDETKHWPSWSKMDASKWTAPLPISEVDGTTTRGHDKNWVEFRAEGSPLYKVEFERSRIPVDDEFKYGSMTLYVDGEEVLGMFVRRDWTKEWSRWQFSIVESLKVGPWIEGFVAFYNRLRFIDENRSEDSRGDCVRAKAAKIDLGDLA